MKARAYIFTSRQEIELTTIQSDLEAYVDILSDLLMRTIESGDRIDGGIELESEERVLTFDDDLWALIQNLCLAPIPQLVNGDVVLVPAFSYPRTVALVPKDGCLEIYDDLDPPPMDSVEVATSIPLSMAVSKTQFLKSMFTIGDGFTNIWQRLSLRHPTFLGLKKEAEHLEELRDVAGAAIDRADLSPL